MKKTLRALCVVLCLTLVLTLAACFEDFSASGQKKSAEDSKRAAAIKPDFAVAMKNYVDADVKKSEFSAALDLSFCQTDNEGALTAIVAKGLIEMNRTQVDDQVYTEGKAFMSPHSDDRVEAGYNTVRRLKDNSYSASSDEIARFLSGKTYYGVRLGYDDDVYNLKAGYYNAKTDEPIKRYWGAAEGKVLPDVLQNVGVDVDLTVSNYLMTNFLAELGSPNNWSKADLADKFFDVDKSRFLYSFVIDEEKLHRIVFDYLGRLISAVQDVDMIADYAAAYDDVLPYLQKWIKVGVSTVQVDVNYDKYPVKIETSFTVELNAPFAEVETVLSTIIHDRKDLNDVLTLLDLAVLTLKPCGTKGESSTIGLVLETTLQETISYNKKTVTFKDADQELFLPLDVEKEDRTVYTASDLPALPNAEEESADERALPTDADETPTRDE